MSETFTTGELLTITTGCLLAPTGVDGLYRIIDYVTGVPHYTHQLPRGADAIKPWLIEQHPWLATVTSGWESVNSESSAAEFCASVSAQHGEHHVVEPLPAGSYIGREPLGELVDMMSEKREP